MKNSKTFVEYINQLNYWQKLEIFWNYYFHINFGNFFWSNNKFQSLNMMFGGVAFPSSNINKLDSLFENKIIDHGDNWKQKGYAQREQIVMSLLTHWAWINNIII